MPCNVQDDEKCYLLLYHLYKMRYDVIFYHHPLHYVYEKMRKLIKVIERFLKQLL